MRLIASSDNLNGFAAEGNDVSALAFSFFNCSTALPGPQITVLPDQSDKSDYTVVASAARDFRGWITVSAYSAVRKTVQVFRRIFCEAKAVYNRRTLIRQGGLRL